jgi:hypothetical protein
MMTALPAACMREERDDFASLRALELDEVFWNDVSTSLHELERARETAMDLVQNGMSSDAPQPVLRIGKIAFATVHDRVPVIMRRIPFVLLREKMTPFEIVVPKVEARLHRVRRVESDDALRERIVEDLGAA